MQKLEKMIDHTILRPDATKENIIKLCKEAIDYGFACVCVNINYVELVSEKLKGSDVKTCCVIGFPLGASLKQVKVYEAREAVKLGAQEIDMVINIGALKDKDYNLIYEEIKAIVDEVGDRTIVKVIVETCLLTDEEKIKACDLSVKAGADFVKTSTGFSIAGANIQDVALMKKTVGDKALVKASGGIKTYEDAIAMMEAGASRIGTSSGIAIVDNNTLQ